MFIIWQHILVLVVLEICLCRCCSVSTSFHYVFCDGFAETNRSKKRQKGPIINDSLTVLSVSLILVFTQNLHPSWQLCPSFCAWWVKKNYPLVISSMYSWYRKGIKLTWHTKCRFMKKVGIIHTNCDSFWLIISFHAESIL